MAAPTWYVEGAILIKVPGKASGSPVEELEVITSAMLSNRIIDQSIRSQLAVSSKDRALAPGCLGAYRAPRGGKPTNGRRQDGLKRKAVIAYQEGTRVRVSRCTCAARSGGDAIAQRGRSEAGYHACLSRRRSRVRVPSAPPVNLFVFTIRLPCLSLPKTEL